MLYKRCAVVYLEFRERREGATSRRAPPHLRRAPCGTSKMFFPAERILVEQGEGRGWRGSYFDLFICHALLRVRSIYDDALFMHWVKMHYLVKNGNSLTLNPKG